MTEVETARGTLADLEAKLAAVTARSVELADGRRLLSFAAHSGEDSAAEKKLRALNTESTHVNLDIENVRSAIEEAKRRLAEAERAEAAAAAAENAEAVMKIADRFAERGRRIDEAFARARAELDGFQTDMDALHALGVTHPRGEQFAVLGGLALASHLMTLPLKVDREHLAPRERRSFTETADAWRASIARSMAPFLEEAA